MTTAPNQLANLSDCICVLCGAVDLTCITASEVKCPSCETSFDVYKGMPCLLQYQASEALSLIEILSNLDEHRPLRTYALYRDWFEMLNEGMSSPEEGST